MKQRSEKSQGNLSFVLASKPFEKKYPILQQYVYNIL
jgi:hypothetical protein